MRNHYQSLSDWSWIGSPTTASGVAQQGTSGNYATAKHSANKQKERRKASEENILCLQECRHIVPTGNKMER